MKIHIIAQRLEKERILPRLANTLANGTGWSISDEPEETADLNYFFPYLELERFPQFNSTPIAAWFTHIDYAQPEKVEIWKRVAKRCDIRLVSARKYLKELEPYGPSYLVIPPLELDRFTTQ